MPPDLDDPRHISASDRGGLGRLDKDPIGTRASIVVVTMIVTIAAMDTTVFGTDTAKELRNGAAYRH